ncbi:metallophosphoesterase 1-like isoform X2 [Coccinella septempunctata]|nr:metallophosphoesterase 1-like isoform X2 [Coccinella septempunctata]
MVIADTHLLGPRNGHWFDKLRREWQMQRAFQTAVALLKPELVFILGDILDEGFYCTSKEFENYVLRFEKMFALPDHIKLYMVPGNHDIGFHYEITPTRVSKFVNDFNASAVQLITVRGNHFVLVNSMALSGDGCFLCKPAEMQLNHIERTLKCSRAPPNSGECDENSRLAVYSKPILMQHFPLYRQSDMECNDFDSAPMPIKQEKFRENRECLSREATYQLLSQIKPRLSLSGHTHHGCTKKLMLGDGIEITIPSFSWRNKNNPTIGLGIFTPNNYSFTKCSLPRETTVILLYIIGVNIIGVWIIHTLLIKGRRKHLK